MPVWKWTLLLVASLILAIIMYSIAQEVFLIIDNLWVKWTVGVVSTIAMIGLYALFVKWFEKHKAKDIPFNCIAQDTAKGLGVGFCFFIGVVLIMMLLGLYRIDSIGTDKPLQILSAFFLFLVVGTGEEIIFRGVLFRWIDEKWGFVVALIASSLIFGFIHISESNATL